MPTPLPPPAPVQIAEAPRAAAAVELVTVIFRPGPAWVAGRPMAQQDLRAHGAYHSGLVREGRSVAAGGYVGQDGGMAILRVSGAAEAAALVEADPAVRSGVFTAELRRWRPLFLSDRPLTELAATGRDR